MGVLRVTESIPRLQLFWLCLLAADFEHIRYPSRHLLVRLSVSLCQHVTMLQEHYHYDLVQECTQAAEAHKLEVSYS